MAELFRYIECELTGHYELPYLGKDYTRIESNKGTELQYIYRGKALSAQALLAQRDIPLIDAEHVSRGEYYFVLSLIAGDNPANMYEEVRLLREELKAHSFCSYLLAYTWLTAIGNGAFLERFGFQVADKYPRIYGQRFAERDLMDFARDAGSPTERYRRRVANSKPRLVFAHRDRFLAQTERYDRS